MRRLTALLLVAALASASPVAAAMTAGSGDWPHVRPEVRPAVAATPPPYRGSVEALPRTLHRRMRGASWRRGCPVPRRDLALVRLAYVDFDGESRRGRMVVHHDVGADVLRVFRLLYRAEFPIERVALLERYGGSERLALRHNVTSAFNCRQTTGGSSWSQHAYGLAVDINPDQNPYVKGDTVLPKAGRRYLDRDRVRKGMIVRPGPVTRAFRRIGWYWGGDWSSLDDWMHFSATGR